MDTRTKASRVPMLDRSARVPMSKRPEGMATTMPATDVVEGGRAEEGMNVGEDFGQKAVAGHGKPDTRLADLVDEDGRDHAHERAEQDNELIEREWVTCRRAGRRVF